MIEVLDKEWTKIKLIIFTDIEDRLLDIKMVKTSKSFNEIQEAVEACSTKNCLTCIHKDNTDAKCVHCAKKELESVIDILDKSGMVTVMSRPIGLTVYNGIKV